MVYIIVGTVGLFLFLGGIIGLVMTGNMIFTVPIVIGGITSGLSSKGMTLS